MDKNEVFVEYLNTRINQVSCLYYKIYSFKYNDMNNPIALLIDVLVLLFTLMLLSYMLLSDWLKYKEIFDLFQKMRLSRV